MKVVTVNCARIIHGNQVATNGVVHVIDRVISAVGNTIKDALDVSDDLSSFNVCQMKSPATASTGIEVFLASRFAPPIWDTFYCLVSQAALLASGMMDKLDQPGHFTLFAPTNEAFDKLNPGYLERIMNDKTVIAGMFYMFYKLLSIPFNWCTL